MKILLLLTLATVATGNAIACGQPAPLPGRTDRPAPGRAEHEEFRLDRLAREAVAGDEAKADNAIRALRAHGPDGFRALLEANATILKRHAIANPLRAPTQTDESWPRVQAALDRVSGQHDSYASQLYWYTDFEQARLAAKAEAKPILSLRLLGKLDEEFSCANSRFFRTTLYANTEVSQYLRAHFILHWQSVRPVPRVTIDFGDGRKLERTLTGNSIHYVLAADGRVIDALPGLYGPKAFREGLQRAEEMAHRTAAVDPGEWTRLLAKYHRARIAALDAELNGDLQRLSTPAPLDLHPFTFATLSPALRFPTAQAAGRLASSKNLVEQPILKNSLPSSTQNRAGPTGIDDATWSRLAALHAGTARLDENSKALMLAKNPSASAAGRLTTSKLFVEDPLLRQIRNLERTISEDTVRNEYLLHPKIHAWLASGAVPEVEELNRKVYAELFLTPDSDPWLGLAPSDTYTALENNGVAQASDKFSRIKTNKPLGR